MPPGIALLRGMREQGTATDWRHWHRRTRILVAAAAGAAIATAATLFTTSVTDALSPLAAVTGALTKTSAESYSFSLDSVGRFNGRELNSDVVAGAFDPRHGLGAELVTVRRPERVSLRVQIRFIGKYVYTWVSPRSGLPSIGKPWDKAPIPTAGAEGMPEGGPYGFVTDQPVSPAELSGVLRSTGKVRDVGPVSGLGWTGVKYVFAARPYDGQESVSGTVYVDQQGRVRRLTTITREERKVTRDTGLIFGGFGAPVSVTAPAASQVKYTSTPWWGVYF
jgi:hypothetical protein